MVSDKNGYDAFRVLTHRLKAASRKRFLTRLDPLSTPENTVLFSVVHLHEHRIQALVAPAIIDSVTFFMEQCAQRQTDDNLKIGTLGTVDWNTGSMKGRDMGSDTL